jgi:hypothetical protein
VSKNSTGEGTGCWASVWEQKSVVETLAEKGLAVEQVAGREQKALEPMKDEVKWY